MLKGNGLVLRGGVPALVRLLTTVGRCPRFDFFTPLRGPFRRDPGVGP